jgi:hypothetical protein
VSDGEPELSKWDQQDLEKCAWMNDSYLTFSVLKKNLIVQKEISSSRWFVLSTTVNISKVVFAHS